MSARTDIKAGTKSRISLDSGINTHQSRSKGCEPLQSAVDENFARPRSCTTPDSALRENRETTELIEDCLGQETLSYETALGVGTRLMRSVACLLLALGHVAPVRAQNCTCSAAGKVFGVSDLADAGKVWEMVLTYKSLMLMSTFYTVFAVLLLVGVLVSVGCYAERMRHSNGLMAALNIGLSLPAVWAILYLFDLTFEEQPVLYTAAIFPFLAQFLIFTALCFYRLRLIRERTARTTFICVMQGAFFIAGILITWYFLPIADKVLRASVACVLMGVQIAYQTTVLLREVTLRRIVKTGAGHYNPVYNDGRDEPDSHSGEVTIYRLPSTYGMPDK